MSTLPNGPWEELSADFLGPFPGGDMLLVMIDDYSRFPEVEIITTTSARAVIPRMDSIFARQGIPTTLRTDNGPPFNGHDFGEFARSMGFQHRKVTPLWPAANGIAERFMRSLNKALRAAVIEQRSWRQELYAFLRAYRATPHSTTGISPMEALNRRAMNIQLPTGRKVVSTPDNSDFSQRDAANKAKMKVHADKHLHTRASTLQVGDTVLVKQVRQHKLTPPFDPRPLSVTSILGDMVTASRDSYNITRNVSHFKKLPNSVRVKLSEPEEGEENENETMTRSQTSTESSETSSNAIHMPTNGTQVDVHPVENNQGDGPKNQSPELRRSKRETRRPAKFKDFTV